MDFAPKAGCPMCGIVASAQHGALGSPRSPSFPEGSTAPEVLWRDDNFTVYREKANPVSTKGHLVIAFKCVVVHAVEPTPHDIYLMVLPQLARSVHLRSCAHKRLSFLILTNPDMPL
jgi:hypothetical protein